MVAHGRVKNGIIALDEGVRLPEELEVTVLAGDIASNRTSGGGLQPHGIRDIPAASLGSVLGPPSAEDDLLGETLEGRS